jgi:Fe2+ transport system protein FeoA
VRCPVCEDDLDADWFCAMCDLDCSYMEKRHRKKMTVTSDAGRVRWRMTLDELCYATKASAMLIEQWAQLGAYGPRWRENRDRGKYRHVTREMAQRAVIMSRLVRAGMKEEAAAKIAVEHQVRTTEPLIARLGEVHITIRRDDLP